MMHKELRLNDCFMSYSAPFPGHEWTESLEALCDRKPDMETMISHRYLLSKVAGIFEDISVHRLAHRKIILLPEETA